MNNKVQKRFSETRCHYAIILLESRVVLTKIGCDFYLDPEKSEKALDSHCLITTLKNCHQIRGKLSCTFHPFARGRRQKEFYGFIINVQQQSTRRYIANSVLSSSQINPSLVLVKKGSVQKSVSINTKDIKLMSYSLVRKHSVLRKNCSDIFHNKSVGVRSDFMGHHFQPLKDSNPEIYRGAKDLSILSI